MLEQTNTALLVIDFQDKLLAKIFNAGAIVPCAIRLIRFAQELRLPIVTTEQYPRGLGPTTETVARELSGAVPITKTAFGCMGEPGFVTALQGAGRSQLLVTGIETHVCIMQTVLAALEAQYETFVVRDAVGSRRAGDHEAALARMEKAGAVLVSTEMAMFEILRDAATPEFKKVLPLLK